MKTLKTSILLIIAVCTFSLAHGQIKLPPPPPHPPLPKIHIGTPPPPPRPGRIVVSGPPRRSRVVVRSRTVRRHYYYRNGVRHYRTY